MQSIRLLDNISSVATSKVLKITGREVMPFQIFGIIDSNVVLEATISSDNDVLLGVAKWAQIVNGSFTEDVCDGIFTSFSHIRAKVLSYNSGTITVTVGL